MEYNTVRPKMIIAEYGRNVQRMIEQLMQEEDRDRRDVMARTIVHVMAQTNPGIKEYNDYKHRLWDHLHIMSDFKLDVDSPYPVPQSKDEKVVFKKPEGQALHIRYRYYGRNIEKIILRAAELPEGEERDAFVKNIANHLKKSYLSWNRDNVTDDVIEEQLRVLSKGQLKLNENDKLDSTIDIMARQKKSPRPKQSHKPGGKSGSSFRKSRRY